MLHVYTSKTFLLRAGLRVAYGRHRSAYGVKVEPVQRDMRGAPPQTRYDSRQQQGFVEVWKSSELGGTRLPRYAADCYQEKCM